MKTMHSSLLLMSMLYCSTQSLLLQPLRELHRLSSRRRTLLEPLPASSIDDVGAEMRAKKKLRRNPRSGAYNREEWSKAFVSQRDEFSYYIDRDSIEGKIPSDLSGSLFRNRPSLFERGGQDYGHYLDGDGYLTRVTLKGGKAHFLGKPVRTEEYAAEEKNEKVLFRSTFRTKPTTKIVNFFGIEIDINNIFNLKLKNQANTNVLNWGGKLMAYFEAGLPHRIDPVTLETIGTDDMNIGLKAGVAVCVRFLQDAFPALHNALFGSFSAAHPKIDPARGVMISWTSHSVLSLTPEAPFGSHPSISIYEWDDKFQPQGPPVQHYFAQSAVAPHDFAFTQNHYLFVENRVDGDILPYILGAKSPASCMSLDSTEPMLLHIVPRPRPDLRSDALETESPLAAPIIVPLAPGFTIHCSCAFEKDNVLELYTSAWGAEAITGGAAKGGLLGNWEGAVPDFDNIPATFLYHTRVDLTSGELLSHDVAFKMTDIIVEHPHINPATQGSVARYMYMCLGGNKGASSPLIGYLRLDLLTGEKQEWHAPLNTFCEELVIVSKKKGDKKKSKNTKEDEDAHEDNDDVWLLASMFNAKTNKACVGIFDGRDISRGPVSTVWMSHALPHSLHGSFDPHTYIEL